MHDCEDWEHICKKLPLDDLAGSEHTFEQYWQKQTATQNQLYLRKMLQMSEQALNIPLNII